MTTLTRRKLFSGLTSVLLATLPSCAITSAARASANKRPFDGRDYPHGCLLARKAGSPCCEGSLPYSSIDFWTFRVSEIETKDLPSHIGLVVVWDDVFSHRSLAESVQDILAVLPRYYGFDLASRSSTFAFHLEGFGQLGSAVATVLSNNDRIYNSSRIALIDIDSCGVSRLEWSDILPHLRSHYDLVIGFVHFAGRGPKDWRVMFGHDASQSSVRAAIAQCDLAFLTSDASLEFDEMLACEARSAPLNKLVHDLIRTLSSSDFRDAVCAIANGGQLMSGMLLQQPLDNKAIANIIERQITSDEPANVSS
jgi:hypothetical protein